MASVKSVKVLIEEDVAKVPHSTDELEAAELIAINYYTKQELQFE